jgi:hypothetical protein
LVLGLCPRPRDFLRHGLRCSKGREKAPAEAVTGDFSGSSQSGLAVSLAVARPKRAACNVTAEFKVPAVVRKSREDSYLWMAPLETTHRFC